MITAGASWIYPYSHPTNGGSIRFEAANFSFGSLGGIDASNIGFSRGLKKNTPGFGPGGGFGSGSTGGGGYGGIGGNNVGNPTRGLTYGDPMKPIQPGSGGGQGDQGDNVEPSGSGGGAIWLETPGSVRVDGKILANGGAGSGNRGSGGSGGGVYIKCKTFIGAGGVIQASGGSNPTRSACGGGGGGRIAVVYDTVEQATVPVPDVVFTTQRGLCSTRYGEIGTLYFPDSRFLVDRPGPIVHTGIWLGEDMPSTLVRDSLVVSNAFLRTVTSLTLDVAGAFTLVGTDYRLHGLDLTNTTINCATLTLEKSGFFVRGGMTDGKQGGYGATVNVTGDMTVGPNSWVYPYSHPTNGGSPKFTMRNLTIAAGGGFDATAAGFVGGAINSDGYGPGRGAYLGSGSGGGGYGGHGGRTNAVCGQVYGTANAPFQPGSGGGGGPNGVGGAGGGSVRIEAVESVLLDGSIFAKGKDYTFFRFRVPAQLMPVAEMQILALMMAWVEEEDALPCGMDSG